MHKYVKVTTIYSVFGNGFLLNARFNMGIAPVYAIYRLYAFYAAMPKRDSAFSQKS